MSAIHIALMAALMAHDEGTGELLVQHEIYGASHELISQVLAPMGVRVRRAHVQDLAEAARALPPRSVIYAETPTNPLIRVADIAEIRRCAPADARLLVDATFASPLNLRPLDLGADLVIHSATKYLGGHHDLLAGVVAGREELKESVWRMRKLFGPVLDPAAAYRLWRGLETLELRMGAHNANAQLIAERLMDHPSVAQVHYPGLPNHPDHALAQKTMRAGGGVLSFEVKGGAKAAAQVIDNVRDIRRAASLGGVSSLLTWPAGVSHVGLTDDERSVSGVSGALLRLALGIEPVESLWRDLVQALEKAS